ncbi:hypothetical protein O3W44_22690 [Pantoea sp. LMR881]|uniref:hypothetical protein n=1 Tax=Pantoea sp. LMR881 TaxID=3014336 RepID=UPI0022AF82A2|nr:hypothetical protein [Pantoea sp. LMR881]MCZ4061342.1 hypothetical protein [Pantoea sp. LMR881]
MRDGIDDTLAKMRRLAIEISQMVAAQEGIDIIPRDYAALLDKADEIFSADNVLLALEQMDRWKNIALNQNVATLFHAGYLCGHEAGSKVMHFLRRRKFFTFSPTFWTAKTSNFVNTNGLHTALHIQPGEYRVSMSIFLIINCVSNISVVQSLDNVYLSNRKM